MPKVHYVKYAVVLITLTLLLAGCPDRTAVQPIPQFTFAPGEGTAPLTVRFEDTSDPGSGAIQAWSWDFGDGSVSNSRNPEHVYRVPGVYDVTLLITTSQGNFSVIKQDAVTVNDSNDFGAPDEANRFTSRGVTIQLPQEYEKSIVFGVAKDTAQIALGAYGPAEVVSPVYTIRHTQESPDLFVFDVNGVVVPATVSFSLLSPLPLSTVPLSKAQLFARLEDGRIVPIPGQVVDHKFVVSVLRLPERADYVVVRRAEMTVTRVSTKGVDQGVAPKASAEAWVDYFTIYASNETEQEITALYRGSMSSETSFKRSDFSALAVEQSMRVFTDSIHEARNDLAATGMSAPILVDEGGTYTLNLFNMYPAYTYDFERATDLPSYDTFFGHMVLDPGQLVAVAIRNLRVAAADEDALDFTERFYPESAFGEALVQSVYPGYEIPSITTTGNSVFGLPVPADRTVSGEVKPVPFIQGLQDGAALYFGRRALNYKGRGFGDNEYGELSSPALFPYSPYVPGYSYAGHELLAWLDGTGYVDDPLSMVARSLEGMNNALQEMVATYTRPIYYREAQSAMYNALDKAIKDDDTAAFTSLADLYWEFLKEFAYVNGWDAIVRPSDTLRLPYNFNEDRFAAESLVSFTFTEAASEVELTPDNNINLAGIEPMTARAIVIDLNPMTTSADIFLDTAMMSYSYVPRVAVYRHGQSGVEFSDMPGDVRNYSLVDTDGDGRTDTVRVQGLGCVDMDCDNRIILLAANLQYEDAADLALTIKTYSDLPVGDEGVLARYVSTFDPQYDYELEQVIDYSTTYGCVVYILRMTSGVWRSTQDVDETLWKHKLVVIEPSNISETTSMLYITGGSANDDILTEDELALVEQLGILAVGSRTAIAMLTTVPNQPLAFEGETLPSTEDEIIAYSFNEYLNSYNAGVRDAAWPALLPMTRAAVRAMDTMQDFMAGKPGRVRNIDKFVVAGIAKRGWAAWLTAAVDERVSAVVPMAADFLNLNAQMEHQAKAYADYPLNSTTKYIYGGYSSSLRDYVDYNVFSRLDTPAGESLLKIVDPYRYRELLTMPKLLINSTGDRSFLPDSSRFFADNLLGPSYLHFAPNTDYSVLNTLDLDEASQEAIGAFYIAQVKGSDLPTMTASYNPGTRQITLWPGETPKSVMFWSANAPKFRDFRQVTLGDKWTSKTVSPSPDGAYRDTIPAPVSGYSAGFMKVTFSGPESSIDHIFTTRIWVTPDTYPVVE